MPIDYRQQVVGTETFGCWLRVHNVAIGLFFLSLVSYPLAWFGVESFVLRDYGVFGYPLAHYFRESFWAGEIPLWNPLNFCGLPFLAQWNTMTLYPPSLIFLLLPMPWSLTVFCLLHQLFGGLGMFVLGRRWSGSALGGVVAAIAFMFNGLTQNSLMWPNNIAALGLLPWVVWGVERACRDGGRWLVGAALLGALQMLSGAPEIILLTWVLSLLFLVADQLVGLRKGRGLKSIGVIMVRFGFVVVLVSGLSAAQLLPFFDFIGQSTRVFSSDHDVWSYGREGWMNLILPLMHGSLSRGGTLFLYDQGWCLSFYPGLFILVMALWAGMRRPSLRTCLMLGLAVMALDLARGTDGMAYPMIGLIIDVKVIRFPVKATLILTFVLPLLAALAIGSAPAEWKRRDLIGLAVAGTALLLVFAAVFVASGGELNGSLGRAQILNNGWVRLMFMVVGLGALLGLVGLKARRGKLAACGLLLLVLWLDLKTHAPGLTPTVSPELFTAAAVDVSDMYPKPELGGGRFVSSMDSLERNHYLTDDEVDAIFLQHRLSLFDNLNLLDGVPKFGGFYSMFEFRMNYIAAVLFLKAPEFPAGLADLLGLCQVTAVGGQGEWEARISAEPLVTAGQRPVYVPDKRAVAALVNPGFNPRVHALFDPGLRGSLTAEASPAAVVSEVVASAHQIRFKVRTSVPTVASIAQTFYHPWQAEIDGSRVPLLRANYAFQAVEVPAGEHDVVLRYVDRSFHKGIMTTLLSLLLCGFCWWRGGRSNCSACRETVMLDPLLSAAPL